MSHFKSSQIEANILFFYRQRVMVVRLVMEGDLGKEAASTTCVDKLFPILSRCSTKVGWTSHRDFVPGRELFLTKEQPERASGSCPPQLPPNGSGVWLRRGTPNSCSPMAKSTSAFPFPLKRCENSGTVEVCHGLALRTRWGHFRIK